MRVDLVKGREFTANSCACYSPREGVRAEPVLQCLCWSCLFLAWFYFSLLWIFLRDKTWGEGVRRVYFPSELLPVLSAKGLLWYLHDLLHLLPPTGPELLSEHHFITAGGRAKALARKGTRLVLPGGKADWPRERARNERLRNCALCPRNHRITEW